MARHRLVKNLDLDDELNDFDGVEDYENEGLEDEGLTEGDQAQMQEGVTKVRAAIGRDLNVTDKEIREALWHYYYDVSKSVSWILGQHTVKQPKKRKKPSTQKHTLEENGNPRPVSNDSLLRIFSKRMEPCSQRVCAADFFKDSPWLQVPVNRRAEILVEPLYPLGRLLGGAPAKPSKLAQLAAARRKKEEEAESTKEPLQESPTLQDTGYIAILEKLDRQASADATRSHKKEIPTRPGRRQNLRTGSSNGETHPRDSGAPYAEAPRRLPSSGSEDIEATPNQSGTPCLQASPSEFASAILGENKGPQTDMTYLRRDGGIFSLSLTSDPKTAEPFSFIDPSPDDIVSAAQKSGGGGNSKDNLAKKTDDQVAKGIINGVKEVSIAGNPRVKSKNLDVLSEYEKSNGKASANFVVIGHVDAGKSTLMGRLLHDLKVVDSRTIDKYRKQAGDVGKSSFALAWVLDQGTEERERGVTIDIAVNSFETEKTKFRILDAPGHRDFIPNMIAGASQADFAVLVVDASPNSFESGLRGQTKEHALLVRSMGVQRILVAINKFDTINWSRDRFEEISQQMSAFLTNAGFASKNISFVPCSGLHGDNVVKRSTNTLASWYTGPLLVEQLDSSEPSVRAITKPFRLTIDDIFRGGITNPLSISGRVEAGSLQMGDVVVAMPSGETATIKSLDVDNETSDWAVAGQNVNLHLSEIDSIHLKTGDVLCDPKSPIHNVTSFTTKILAFDHVTPMHVDVHRGRLFTSGRITKLLASLDKGSGAVVKKRPRVLQPGSVARIVVELENAVPLEAPGRVILRAEGSTIAAGLLE